jgi:peroxiredoxin (alkyl hydroperoxide reductase subunit C)
MTNNTTSCVEPARGPIVSETEEIQPTRMNKEEEVMMTVRVGKPAPDFEVVAHINGKFETIRLSDYKGKWVVLCFYPGDFTFV